MSKERRTVSQQRIKRIQRSSRESILSKEEAEKELQKKGLPANTKLYYTKVISGSSLGSFCGLIFSIIAVPTEVWVMILIIGLVLTVLAARHVIKIDKEELNDKKLWLSGSFTFILLFIVTSSLIWMFFSIIF